jgi:hypothetical protein
MRKKLMTAVLVVMTLLAPGLVPPAAASNAWISIGSVFRIGAAHVAIALGSPFGYEPAYYYRYDQPIHYSGYRCSRYCFHEGAYDYHHESCPLVAAHFSHYRVDPRWAFDNYAPRYSGYDGRYRDGYGYDRYGDRYDRRGYDRYDRYDDRGRYDRYDRHDRYDRYDDRYDRGRRDRDRGHRHYKGCGHGY